ncbi:12043_t:CDS:10 [Acaulospora morrowiae]|uniref:12043_t:CDS:1 n=1 Tax=Acaulospora morrowiae TaxID=94023 RepID=A0A9N9ATV5_9GLOM|nr:12043_t:CDS:10 [Acaulospora morrowiae]
MLFPIQGGSTQKSPEDESEGDGVHVDSGEFPNYSLIGRNDAENPLFVSGHYSNDATVNQDESVPLNNTHKWLYSEIGDDLLSSHIMSVMEKYRSKLTSKYDLVHSFILDLTPFNTTYYEEIGSSIRASYEKLRSKQPKLHESQDWKKILYWVERAVGALEIWCASRDSSNLFTIGIQLYMTEIRIYMMEKRGIYRLHLLKSFKHHLLCSSYEKLLIALSWAWNIKGIFVQGLVKELSLKSDDSAIVSAKTPKRSPPNEMKTIKTS